jgi:hypothetical protein
MDNQKIETKEDFCPVCIAAIPLAFSGAVGTSTALSDNEHSEKERKRRKLIYKWSIIIGILSLGFIIYFLFIKPCNECK